MKIIKILNILVVGMLLLSGCGKKGNNEESSKYIEISKKELLEYLNQVELDGNLMMEKYEYNRTAAVINLNNNPDISDENLTNKEGDIQWPDVSDSKKWKRSRYSGIVDNSFGNYNVKFVATEIDNTSFVYITDGVLYQNKSNGEKYSMNFDEETISDYAISSGLVSSEDLVYGSIDTLKTAQGLKFKKLEEEKKVTYIVNGVAVTFVSSAGTLKIPLEMVFVFEDDVLVSFKNKTYYSLLIYTEEEINRTNSDIQFPSDLNEYEYNPREFDKSSDFER